MKKVTDQITVENKLTAEELTSLQSLVSDYNSIQLKCGDLEIQKHQLLHQLANVSQSLETLQAELKETYGDVVVDINTGEFKPKEDEVNS